MSSTPYNRGNQPSKKPKKPLPIRKEIKQEDIKPIILNKKPNFGKSNIATIINKENTNNNIKNEKLRYNLNIITGDESGLLKVNKTGKQGTIITKCGEQKVDNSISHIIYLNNNEENILFSNKNGMISNYDVLNNAIISNYDHSLTQSIIKGHYIKGLCMKDEYLISASMKGEVYFKSMTNENEDIKLLQVENMNCMKLYDNNMAYGGKNVDLTLYDITTEKAFFKAKNTLPDKLGLYPPIAISTLTYLTSQTLATGTDFNHIRLYDVRTNRRPLTSVTHFKSPINCVVPYTDNYLLASDGAGHVFKMDVRKNLQLLGSYKGNHGSVRHISVHPTLPIISTVGLDRYIRIYNADNYDPLRKIYQKQRLNTVLISKEATEIADAEDEETIWKQIEGNKITKIKEEPEDEDQMIDTSAFLQGDDENNSIDGSDNEDEDEDEDSEGNNSGEDHDEDSEQEDSNNEDDSQSEQEDSAQEDSDEVESEESEEEEPVIVKKKAIAAPIGKRLISKPMAVQNTKKFNPRRK